MMICVMMIGCVVYMGGGFGISCWVRFWVCFFFLCIVCRRDIWKWVRKYLNSYCNGMIGVGIIVVEVNFLFFFWINSVLSCDFLGWYGD